MATSPLTVGSPDEKDDNNLTPKEFGERLDTLAKHHNNLMKLSSKVYALGKTQRLQYPNGATVGRKELRTLSSQFVKELKSLKKNYTSHGKKPRRKRREGGSAGFKNPILVTDNMRAFFSQANLGPSDPTNPASTPLNQVLAVGQNGVTTRAIMTPLFNIYAHVNNMQKDPENKQYLTATPQMNQFFQETYARLAAKPQKFQKNKETGEPDMGKTIPRFDPNRFRYASIQSIVADNTVPNEALNQQQKVVLARLPVNKDLPDDLSNPHKFVGAAAEIAAANATINRLEQEQALVSGILTMYRDAKKDLTKATKGGKAGRR
jgi:hypothetical protein